jgi:hypothetical protein
MIFKKKKQLAKVHNNIGVDLLIITEFIKTQNKLWYDIIIVDECQDICDRKMCIDICEQLRIKERDQTPPIDIARRFTTAAAY